MYTQELAAPRGGAAVVAIVIHGVLIYGLAIGLGAVPKPSFPDPFTVVTVQPDDDPIPQQPIESRLDPRVIDDTIHIPSPAIPNPIIERSEPPPVGDETQIRSVFPPPAAESPFMQARILQSFEPPYPSGSIVRQEEGTVFVRITLSVDGRIAGVQLERSSGIARLDDAAIKAVRAWRFAPATRGGQGVSTSVVVPVKFQLRQ